MAKKQAAQPVPLSAVHGHDAHFGVGRGIAGDVLGEDFKVKSRKIIPIEKEGADGRDVWLPLSICCCNGNVEVGGEAVAEVLADGLPIFGGDG